MIGGDWLWSLSFPLRSSSSQQRFRGLFIGGGAVGEAACVGGGDGAGRCRRDGGVIEKGSRGSVWVLFVRVAGLPRNLRRFRRRWRRGLERGWEERQLTADGTGSGKKGSLPRSRLHF
jgi:hypothetical protein